MQDRAYQIRSTHNDGNIARSQGTRITLGDAAICRSLAQCALKSSAIPTLPLAVPAVGGLEFGRLVVPILPDPLDPIVEAVVGRAWRIAGIDIAKFQVKPPATEVQPFQNLPKRYLLGGT